MVTGRPTKDIDEGGVTILVSCRRRSGDRGMGAGKDFAGKAL